VRIARTEATKFMRSSSPETRNSLLLRLQDREDVDAWEEFVAIYSPVVFRVALCKGFQQADAENIVQEVLLAVARSLEKWLDREDRGPFHAWLLRIARNTAFDLISSKSTRELGKDGSEAERFLAELHDPTELSSALDLEEERAIFGWASAQARKSVAEQTWRAFWLTEVEGLSPQEVSDSLKIRIGKVYVARCRVMARIKELVARYIREQSI
jgi:RNA polymerase sigma-70 factor, ECF subfamily